MAIIAHLDGIIEPTAVDGYSSSRRSNNVVHIIPGSPNPDVTLRPASLRTGTLRMVFADEDAAKAAEDAHSSGAAFTLTADERPTLAMHYVVSGDVTRELGTAGQWVVQVGYQEIAP